VETFFGEAASVIRRNEMLGRAGVAFAGFVTLAVVTAVAAATTLVTSRVQADGGVAGSQGTDTALPATASQATVKGRDAFASLTITVNQTANLTNQAVSVTWVGATPTVTGPGRFASQYLQIMQCWGEDDGTVADNPGPPPQQCEQGGFDGKYGGTPVGVYPGSYAVTRIISKSSWPNFVPSTGVLDRRTTEVWMPFRSVDGTSVGIQTDPTFNPSFVGGNYWLNPFYNFTTTNEIPGAATGPDGRGAELFQVLTGRQASGLGCGQSTEPTAGGGKKVPQCWLVVVPRGSATDENAGTPFDVAADQYGVVSSPISPAAWQHRIAIPIDFNPVDSPCPLGADERRIAGSELALPAVGSWQPSLCSSAGLPPYSYSPISDSAARQQLVSGQPGAPGMVVVSRPLSTDSISATNPVLYAPVSASGLVIGFNIERFPSLDATDAERQLSGIRLSDLNLTPRLVAKLLTQSYSAAVAIYGAPNYAWLVHNSVHMGVDPDFRRFNPEFDLIAAADSRTFSSLHLPEGNSDAAQQVWEWVFADPEARAWLAGAPDEWGMRVNPVYSTDAAANPTGSAFGDPVPSSFPKSDPYCYKAPTRGSNNSIVPPPLCGTDWVPYSRSLSDAAQVARLANDAARITENPFALSSSDAWLRADPQYLGRRDMLAITDTPSAAQFGLQIARLSRAGDNGAGRSFVSADTPGLVAGVSAMRPGSDPTVLQPDPSVVMPGAYPLTIMTYAALAPLGLDTHARTDYASFIDYAAGDGQVPGLALGQLPAGFAPLPEYLRAQAKSVAQVVRTLVAPQPDATVPTTEPQSTTSPTTTAATTTAAVAISGLETTAAATTTPQVPSVVDLPGAPVVQESATANAVPPARAPTTPRSSTPTLTPRSTLVSTTISSVISTSTIPPASTAVETTTTTTPSPATTALSTAAPTSTSATSTTLNPLITPRSKLAKSRYVAAGLGVTALGSALCALEISRRPRRLLGDDDSGDDLDGTGT
jgi:hypothetical protein